MNTELKNCKNQKLCKRCKRTNHTIEKCWIEHPELRKRKPQRTVNYHMQQDGGKTEVEEVFTGFHTGSETEKQDDEMIIDNGANISITNDKTVLQDFQEFGRYTTVMASNGGTLQAIGKGTMILSVEPKIAIPNMLYVPKITKTLISTNCITNQGYEIHIKGDLTVSTPEGKPVLKAKNRNGLYYLTRPNKEANSVTAISKFNVQKAHR